MLELTGRRVIKTAVQEITQSNILSVIDRAMPIHQVNAIEEGYLFDYYRGQQPILHRKKEVRPDICNKIIENRANEIISFKVGYQCGEPIQYVATANDPQTVDEVAELNKMMNLADKHHFDKQLIEDSFICGTGYRMVLPKQGTVDTENNAPFEIYQLKPQSTFVVYSAGVSEAPLLGVWFFEDSEGRNIYYAYTDRYKYVLKDNNIVSVLPHTLGYVPIIEYPANSARLGVFEKVIPLLDALNMLDSNRLDGVEQVVQSYIKFINCDIDKSEYEEFLKKGAIRVFSHDGQKADVDQITITLDQTQVQTLKDDIIKAIIRICGLPAERGGASTSDTGTAVLLRDGWSEAEARAKSFETDFKYYDRTFQRIVLTICSTLRGFKLNISDIDTTFTRRNYEAVQAKAQVLISMLSSEKIHPLLAFTHCGMFTDPEGAYLLSVSHYEETLAKQQEALEKQKDNEQSVQDNGGEGGTDE